jgi:hypothetical protein
MVALGHLEFLTPKHAWTCRRTASATYKPTALRISGNGVRE